MSEELENEDWNIKATEVQSFYNILENILLNRMHILNDKVEKNLIDLTLTSYKVKCKELFLQG